jgi:hypothetical protein
VLCLIDGFNPYHSLRDCERDTDARVRWLDLRSLCESPLHVLPGECAICEVVYFSALAHPHRHSGGRASGRRIDADLPGLMVC